MSDIGSACVPFDVGTNEMVGACFMTLAMIGAGAGGECRSRCRLWRWY
jgi:hypothetical protein